MSKDVPIPYCSSISFKVVKDLLFITTDISRFRFRSQSSLNQDRGIIFGRPIVQRHNGLSKITVWHYFEWMNIWLFYPSAIGAQGLWGFYSISKFVCHSKCAENRSASFYQCAATRLVLTNQHILNTLKYVLSGKYKKIADCKLQLVNVLFNVFICYFQINVKIWNQKPPKTHFH